MSGKCIMTIS